MRYLVQRHLSSELAARRMYIDKSLHLWCLPTTSIGDFEQLISIPPTALDTLFIIGHNISVAHFLRSETIPEKTIVAITCSGAIDYSWLKSLGKTVYFSKQNKNGFAELLKGDMFNFGFDLTESEILLYNTRRNINFFERLDICFTKL